MILFFSYSYGEQIISDTSIRALQGEKVALKLKGGVKSIGLLKKVEESTIILVYNNGDIAEIDKNDILSVRIVKKSLNQVDSPPKSKNSYNRQPRQPIVMRPALPIVLNVFLPFGIGSWVQKDTRTGIALAVMDSLWWVSVITISAVAFSQLGHQGGQFLLLDSQILERVPWTVTAISVISGIWAVTRLITGIAGPIRYYKKNRRRNRFSIMPRFLPEVAVNKEIQHVVGFHVGFDLIKRF